MSQSNRILVVDEMHESILPLLQDAGFQPVYMPLVSREDILQLIPDFDGLVIRSKTDVDKELIDAAVNLKFVARAGAGLDKLDAEYLSHKNIKVFNAPEGNRDALGEHTLGMLLSLLHRLSFSFGQIRKGQWDRNGNRGIELKGKVVGIYGMGYMGMSFAKKLSGLECYVIGYDKYKEGLTNDYITQVSLDEFKEQVEILSIHVPLQDDTKGLFHKSHIKDLKNIKILINTSRGEVLKTSDVVELLEDDFLYGVGLDVLENEKLDSYSKEEQSLLDKLSSMPNVLLTPHVGGWTFESYQRINEVLVEKLKASFLP